ncbi:MAG: hypothetical protein PHD54_13380 [Desulfuromonadaceae bacterium]|nr:hypothetical protein [Desulfuromonadaceae bacterium]
MAAVIFIFQGIRTPNFSNPQEPRLSSSQKVEPPSNAVIKTLLQSPLLKIVKTAQLLDIICNELQIKTPAVHISSPLDESHSFITATVSVLSARAPPA